MSCGEKSAAVSTGEKQEKIDSVYNFTAKVSGKFRIVKIDSAQHEDFCCLSEVVRESGACKSNQHYNKALSIVLPFLEEHLKNLK